MKNIKDAINSEFKINDTITLITKFGSMTGIIVELNQYHMQITGCNPTFKYLSYDILYTDISEFSRPLDYDLGI